MRRGEASIANGGPSGPHAGANGASDRPWHAPPALALAAGQAGLAPVRDRPNSNPRGVSLSDRRVEPPSSARGGQMPLRVGIWPRIPRLTPPPVAYGQVPDSARGERYGHWRLANSAARPEANAGRSWRLANSAARPGANATGTGVWPTRRPAPGANARAVAYDRLGGRQRAPQARSQRHGRPASEHLGGGTGSANPQRGTVQPGGRSPNGIFSSANAATMRRRSSAAVARRSAATTMAEA